MASRERDPGLAAGAVEDDDRQVGGEPLDLAGPRREDGGRRDDEHRVGELAALLGAQRGRDDLQRLAQAHVVGEDATEAEVPQQREPPEALLLVGPQRRLERAGHLGRRRGVGVVDPEQGVDGPAPAPGLLLDDADLDELVPQPGVQHGEPQRVGRPVLQRAGLLDERAQPLQLGVVEGEPGAVGQEQPLLVAGERRDEVGERDLVVADGDADPQVEPVVAVGGLARADRDPRGLRSPRRMPSAHP